MQRRRGRRPGKGRYLKRGNVRFSKLCRGGERSVEAVAGPDHLRMKGQLIEHIFFQVLRFSVAQRLVHGIALRLDGEPRPPEQTDLLGRRADANDGRIADDRGYLDRDRLRRLTVDGRQHQAVEGDVWKLRLAEVAGEQHVGANPFGRRQGASHQAGTPWPRRE